MAITNPNIEGKTSVNLTPLVPNKQAENSELYCQIIQDALEDKDSSGIFNIALTGGYGSGKSSIIETFLSKNSEKYKTIRISLANFNLRNEKAKNIRKSFSYGNNSDSSNENIQLEISLLQQFIFQSQNWEQKNENYFHFLSKNKRIFISISLIFLGFLSFGFLWEPDVLNKIVSSNIFDFLSECILLRFLSIISLILTCTWFLYHLFWNLNNWTSAKINIAPSFSMELSSKSDKSSILNYYLYEIVKLFKQEKIKLVILEDIDRLDDHEIFEKLKEINNIIRFNPSTKDLRTVFLYSLKESVFKNEKDKNKFFDLIVPVIPFVNASNSKEKLLESLKSIDIKITNEIKSIVSTSSLCIDEMRTILNISNDFKIYYNLLKSIEHFSDEKLLAIVIYKNLFPIDFEKIHNGTSSLNKLFSRRDELEKKCLKNDYHGNKFSANELSSIPFSNIYDFSNEKLDPESFGLSTVLNYGHVFYIDYLDTMIKNGFITPDFMDYTSFFYNGYLSSNDKKYILKLRKNEHIGFNEKIENIDALFKELLSDDWTRVGILNFEIFEHCFKTNRQFLLENTFKNRNYEKSILYDHFSLKYYFFTKYRRNFVEFLMKKYPNYLIQFKGDDFQNSENSIFVRESILIGLMNCSRDTLNEVNKNNSIDLECVK